MADRIAMFNKNKTDNQGAKPSNQPILNNDNTESPLKEVIKESQINELNSTQHSLLKPNDKPVMMRMTDSNSKKSQDTEAKIEPSKVKSSAAQFDFKLEKPSLVKGKSEKVFGMANNFENRFKMMGMPLQKKTEQEKTEIPEEDEEDFFKTKARSQSLAAGPQINKLVEIKMSQTEIMDMKPSIKDKRKMKKPQFEIIEEAQEGQEFQEDIDPEDPMFEGRKRTSTC